jgi:hypothetical protein
MANEPATQPQNPPARVIKPLPDPNAQAGGPGILPAAREVKPEPATPGES